MKRLLLAVAAVTISTGGVFGAGAARADSDDASAPMEPGTISMIASSTNDLLSKIPGMGGGTVRHICLIYDPLDVSYCIFIPLP